MNGKSATQMLAVAKQDLSEYLLECLHLLTMEQDVVSKEDFGAAIELAKLNGISETVLTSIFCGAKDVDRQSVYRWMQQQSGPGNPRERVDYLKLLYIHVSPATKTVLPDAVE